MRCIGSELRLHCPVRQQGDSSDRSRVGCRCSTASVYQMVLPCVRRWLAAVVAALGAPHCSSASRDTALSVIEHLLAHQTDNSATAAAYVPAGGFTSDTMSSDDDEEMLKLQGGTSANQGSSPSAGGKKGDMVPVVGPALERHRPELLAALRAVVMTAMGVAPSAFRVRHLSGPSHSLSDCQSVS